MKRIKAKKRLNRSILNDNLDIPDEVLDLMERDVLSAVGKYLETDENNFEMKYSRKADNENCEGYIEFGARMPIDEPYLKTTMYH